MPEPRAERFGLDPNRIRYDKEGFQVDPTSGKRVDNGGIIDINTGATIRVPIDLRTGLPVDYKEVVR